MWRTLLASLVASVAVAAEPLDVHVKAATETAITQWSAPGVAVAVVRDGKTVYLAGHGTKRLGKDEPVTPDTVFPMASCTKAFTSALMASLVDDGKLDWDDPVRKHCPAFALSDPNADKLVAVRDLFQHRTGLGGHDLLWYRAPWGPEEAVKRIGKLPLSVPFRTEFQYTSLPVTAAGFVAAKAGGATWDKLMRERLCEPLGMKSVAFTTAAADKFPDRAAGHRLTTKGKVEPMPANELKEPDAAGSLFCSVRDVVPWMNLHLADGVHGDKRIVSAANLAETRHPATPLRRTDAVKATHPTATQVSYAMGWVVYDHRGKPVVAHGGILDGFRSLVMLLPDEKVGIAVLANLHDTRMNMALGHTLIDLMLDLPKGDWNKHYLAVAKAEADAKAEARKRVDAAADPTVRPSLALEKYAGDYEDAAYGVGKLTHADGKLVWEWSSYRVPLAHWRGDVFRASEGFFADELFGIRVVDGKAVGLIQRGVEFKRK